MTIRRYTRRPTTVPVAGPWDGTPESHFELQEFVGGQRNWWSSPHLKPARVYNILEEDWIKVPLGHHVVCGTHGECYPIAPELLDPNNPDRTYDLAESTDPVA